MSVGTSSFHEFPYNKSVYNSYKNLTSLNNVEKVL